MSNPGAYELNLIEIIQEPSLMEMLSPHSIFQLCTGIALMVICALTLAKYHGQSAVCLGGVLLGGVLVDLATDSGSLLHQHILAIIAYMCASGAYLTITQEKCNHNTAAVVGLVGAVVYALLFDYFVH